jgi:cytochrome c2
MRTVFLLVGLAVCSHAWAEPFAGGNPAQGKKWVDKDCSACHVSLHGGDGSKIYTRAERTITTAEQLGKRVHTCNVNSGAGWSAAQELDAAAFLNRSYYHFK